MTSEIGSNEPQVELVVVPRSSDLGGGFIVRRALPSARRRMVGPFVFFDEMGPVTLEAGNGLDVRPHPHIGLATVTYLFEGEIEHKDSLGTVQRIRPGELNWMTAGKGIAHSERSPAEVRKSASRMAGIQTWVALPAGREESDPGFVHYGREALPVIEGDGAEMGLIVGSLHGQRSPVVTMSEMFYASVSLTAGARFELRAEHEERAAYIVEGAIEVEGEAERAAGGSSAEANPGVFEAGRLVVFRGGTSVVLRGCAPVTRLMLLGGAAMDGPRHVWWNFVSSSEERIEQAKRDWVEKRFGQVPGETEFIPLPPDAPRVAKYP